MRKRNCFPFPGIAVSSVALPTEDIILVFNKVTQGIAVGIALNLESLNLILTRNFTAKKNKSYIDILSSDDQNELHHKNNCIYHTLETDSKEKEVRKYQRQMWALEWPPKREVI